MQWMKSHAASIRIVDWDREQVIDIDEQAQQHDGIGAQPIFAVKTYGR